MVVTWASKEKVAMAERLRKVIEEIMVSNEEKERGEDEKVKETEITVKLEVMMQMETLMLARHGMRKLISVAPNDKAEMQEEVKFHVCNLVIPKLGVVR